MTRRFPDTVTRRRRSGGSFNDDGRWDTGTVTEVEMPARVLPHRLEAKAFADGLQRYNQIVVYLPLGAAEQPAVTPVAADGYDQIIWQGRTFDVSEVRAYPDHTEAVCAEAVVRVEGG